MNKNKLKKAKLNILTTFLRQLLTALCGIVIPRVMIGAFGSIVYGATTSIAQFLSYISLLEGGIGRVARGALYVPLAENDNIQISGIYQSIKKFFAKVGVIFVIYTVILAVLYYDIAGITGFDRSFIAGLVVVISLSTIANYLFGIANMTLLHADQKQYMTNTVITITNIINTISIVVLVMMDVNVLMVKLVSSLIFIVRPMLYSYYVKKQYSLVKGVENKEALNQKWTGIGQHVAYFVHTNTDVILLTMLADLKYVAIYSVYRLVVFNIWNIASSFSGGMEAAFGEMLAKKDKDTFEKSYRYYKALLTTVTLILFGCTAVLIIPFIKLYMAGVTDANYVQPVFGLILLMAEAMNCFSLPCSSIPVAGNCLKETKWGAYGEAIINISISLVLIPWNPLLGVAIGTFAATVFKCVYYMNYTANHFLKCSRHKILGTFAVSFAILFLISIIGMCLLMNVVMSNFFEWIIWGIIVFSIISIIAILAMILIYPKETKSLLYSSVKKLKKRTSRNDVQE